MTPALPLSVLAGAELELLELAGAELELLPELLPEDAAGALLELPQAAKASTMATASSNAKTFFIFFTS